MSEKLRRCRKELAAALDRAFEDSVTPSLISAQDYSIHLIPECQPSPPTASPKITQFLFGENFTAVPSYVPQSFPVCCSPENVYPAVLPRHLTINANRITNCPKRRPLASKENVMMNSVIHDEQPIGPCGDSEHWKKINLRKDPDRNLKPEVNVSQSIYGHEITKDLLDIIEHTSIQTIQELTGKLEFDQVLNKVCASPLKEDVLGLFEDDNCSDTTDAEAKQDTLIVADDDSILETVLDLEEEYDLLPSAGQIVHS